jgi:hypothetical protein
VLGTQWEPRHDQPDQDGHTRLPAAANRWAACKRQVIAQLIYHLKDFFALERLGAKALSDRLARLAANVTAYAAGQNLNQCHGHPAGLAGNASTV